MYMTNIRVDNNIDIAAPQQLHSSSPLCGIMFINRRLCRCSQSSFSCYPIQKIPTWRVMSLAWDQSDIRGHLVESSLRHRWGISGGVHTWKLIHLHQVQSDRQGLSVQIRRWTEFSGTKFDPSSLWTCELAHKSGILVWYISLSPHSKRYQPDIYSSIYQSATWCSVLGR